jgi:hypothetical protein
VPFDLCFPISFVNHTFFVYGPVCVPFMLPPLQEFFDDTNFRTKQDTPKIRLRSMWLSWDQSGEAAAISNAAATVGFLNYANVGLTGITVQLLEKVPTQLGGPVAHDREVFFVQIPALAFTDPFRRSNPFYKGDLAVELNPYRSYLLCINLTDPVAFATAQLCLPSLTVNFECEHPTVARDAGGTIQNLPVRLAAGKVGPVINLLQPNAGAVITADNATTGVQANVRLIDALFRGKLDGGMTNDSDQPVAEALLEDSGYEVICVPMWQNVGTDYLANTAALAQLPYAGAAGPPAYPGPCVCRVVLPLDYPFTVHHVIAAVNYANGGVGTHPLSATYIEKVGVAIGQGLRGDGFQYDDVAFQTWTAADKGAKLTDKIKQNAFSLLSVDPTEDWAFELRTVPLVTDGVTFGKGWRAQGKPYFMGRSTLGTQPRANAGTVAGAPAVMEGAETYLECRWSFADTAGLGVSGVNTVFAGAGGAWIFLIGKKSAARVDGDIPA